MKPWSQASGRVRCMRTMPLLQSYLDGALDDVAAHRVASHLEDCRRCGLEISVYTEIKVALGANQRHVDVDAFERLRTFAAQLAQGAPGYGDHGA